MNERRIERLQELIKERIATVVQRELADPRMGIVTITRVRVDRELTQAQVFWSVLGTDTERRLNEKMLKDATPFIQREVAPSLRTRTMPKLMFTFDESIGGVARMEELFSELRKDRGEEEPADLPEDEGIDREPDNP